MAGTLRHSDPDRTPGRSRAQQEWNAKKRRRDVWRVGIVAAVVLLALGGSAAWVAIKGTQLKDNLQSTTQLLPQLKQELTANDKKGAAATVAALASHTAAAKAAGTDPVWKAASSLPWIGPNLAAGTDIAVTADDVVQLAAKPLVGAFDSLDWKSLTPSNGAVGLEALTKAAPSVVSAANTVQLSHSRLADIDKSRLLPQIADPLTTALAQLDDLRGTLNVASSTVQLLPAMLGETDARNYLLLIQNNAEVRATGGIPGALAVLHAEKGKITLATQDSASHLGTFDPPVPVDPTQEAIYSHRLGSYMQDVNMTPDFPTAAATARTMWQERHPGQTIDGVITLDPVALSKVVAATGPIDVRSAIPAGTNIGKLPTTLNGGNLVKALLSDVYANIEDPAVQDAYFAAVAKDIFTEVSSGKAPSEKLIAALASGVQENRIRVWSSHPAEQNLLAAQRIGGAISGPGVPAAAFGVYFNDGTGAKMDYYVKRTVQLIQKCTTGGYGEYTAKVTLTNTAPADAATALPNYVTGGGAFGIKPGNVATNVIAYGPSQARAQAVRVNGKAGGFASYAQDDRPVGVVRVELAPGESTTVEVDFSKVVQSSPAQLDVTPTVQKNSDVVMPLKEATGCAPTAP